MDELLQHIGGWHVGCVCHIEVAALVERAERDGYVARRRHFAPGIPEGADAFELTDEGLRWLREHSGEQAAEEAGRVRQWYRDNTSQPPLRASA